MYNKKMINVKIAEFRSHLSEYLKKIRLGEEIIILDRDHPIGRLVSFENKKENVEALPKLKSFAKVAKMKFPRLNPEIDIVAELIKERRRR
ncbi:MAG: type II toxin-antitoxin system Phd/YefM family antitoxin [Deltaproteobacteria bacterium]|nr:type II toxin-antitoxin system Phd/YefM family antitoxin [Deltaproteobacteria bacterium]